MAEIGIIGAGIAGIASAIRMAVKGHQVDVFEANSYAGGKLSDFKMGDYRFDAGPSLFTMPMYVEELFKLANRNPKHYIEYERLPVVCNYFWEDEIRLSAYADPQRFGEEVKEKLDVDPSRLQKMMADSQRKYDISGQIFLEKSLHKKNTWLKPKVLKAMMLAPTMDLFSTMNQVNQRYLKHPKLVQLFNRFATYNGSNPYKAPGILSIIPHFEHHFGAYIPKGGMVSITKSLVKLAKEEGVRFHFNTKVDEIIVEQKRAMGLRIGRDMRYFDTIISNMDVFFTYRKLLPNIKHPERTLAQEKSTSALIFYWGIKKQLPELDLHNILFTEDYKKEFDYLQNGKILDDPTVYINITSKYCKADAPEGGENWFTMINVPYNSGQDWETMIATARKQIIKKINRILKIDVESLIECEDILDPRTIESRTSSHLGSLYGTSSNNRMAAFLRHPNFSNKIKGLYFCGGSVHPGGGIPLCLLSAKIVDEMMEV